MIAPAAVGVDVGGTAIKAVAIDPDGTVVRECRTPTPQSDPSGGAVVAAVGHLVDELSVQENVPVGVVVPGIVDDARGVALMSANLGWKHLPVAELIEQRLGRPVRFGHDVRAGGLAELRWGAAQNAADVVAFVAIGTGIAAALFVGGRPLVSGGWAGEIGQVPFTNGPFAGQRMESVASAAAVARRAGLPHALAVAHAVEAGDARAREVWDESLDVLADALVALTAAVGPERIVIGGGLALAGDLLLSPLEQLVNERLGVLRRPSLCAAVLGDRAGALGAAAAALEMNP